MDYSFASLFDTIIQFNWVEIFKALAAIASIVTPFIAFAALRNWKRQDKAKREAEFLDSLVDTTHAFIEEINRPIFLLEMARIAISAHAPTWDAGDQTINGAIIYIKKQGETESKRLRGMLNTVQPIVVRLRSLAAKGQIFKFKRYKECQNAVKLLVWQFDRISAFTTIIGSSSTNWDHPDARKSLETIVAIDPADIRKQLGDNNVAVLEFAQSAYKRSYG